MGYSSSWTPGWLLTCLHFLWKCAGITFWELFPVHSLLSSSPPPPNITNVSKVRLQTHAVIVLIFYSVSSFPILNQTVIPYLVLTVASWPAYRFLRRLVKWSGILISLRICPQFVVIHTVKGFNVVREAEGDVFFWNSLAFTISNRCWSPFNVRDEWPA